MRLVLLAHLCLLSLLLGPSPRSLQAQAQQHNGSHAPPSFADSKGSCHFGQLPGALTDFAAPPGERYELFTEDCKLANLLKTYSNASSVHGRRQVAILFLGDSVDWFTLHGICKNHLNGTVLPTENKHERSAMTLTYCQTGHGLQLAMHYVLGVHPSGPYLWQYKGNLTDRVRNATAMFRSTYNVTHPHAVIVSANLWDLGRICHEDKAAVCANSTLLPGPFVREWARNYTAFVEEVKAAMQPYSPLLIYHTTLMPRANCSDGKVQGGFIGNRGFVYQLNMAGKAVAHRLRMHVVDFNDMFHGLVAEIALFDNIHPVLMLREELFNVYLNIIEQSFEHTGYTSTTSTSVDPAVERRRRLRWWWQRPGSRGG